MQPDDILFLFALRARMSMKLYLAQLEGGDIPNPKFGCSWSSLCSTCLQAIWKVCVGSRDHFRQVSSENRVGQDLGKRIHQILGFQSPKPRFSTSLEPQRPLNKIFRMSITQSSGGQPVAFNRLLGPSAVHGNGSNCLVMVQGYRIAVWSHLGRT